MRREGTETLSIFIEDRRYSVPTLQMMDHVDIELAPEIVRRILERSPHYASVEARNGDRLLCRIERAPPGMA